ncbi:membrane protein [Rhizobium phaseoli]|uniref:DUF3618 domain-containing protein n=1 Tax=Rhizobium phaseoli TaxID=396 RepID=A0ABN4QT99_9HYPH|nr:membrane protein [Rhizobium phaseoli]KEC70171.1 hypothetical protein RLPCCGM1_p0962 [Rhizobium leguminosarum bv. phaseoli CCGM1]ANL56931.1 hypothetical protein AMC86_PD00472 [Rhizobium phaseoli]ANL88705.1 hypothetical protein AMC81_PE00459 [Rhizobium phaseoli]ANL95214.1 hypothetical protein AMC80_PE00459 [Rhizobium phaseoli]PWI51305.1 hypothetical protein B5K03_24515 [Rhizobium phaseoli]
MPRRKTNEMPTLDTTGAKIGEPVPKAIIDVNTASVGIPRQPEEDLRAELSALRRQLETLQQQILDAGQLAKDSASQAIRQTETVVKQYPLSTVALMVAVVGLLALGSRQVLAPRRREPSVLHDLRDYFDRARGWI